MSKTLNSLEKHLFILSTQEMMFLSIVTRFTRAHAEIPIMGRKQKCPALQPSEINPQMTKMSSPQIAGCHGSFKWLQLKAHNPELMTKQNHICSLKFLSRNKTYAIFLYLCLVFFFHRSLLLKGLQEINLRMHNLTAKSRSQTLRFNRDYYYIKPCKAQSGLFQGVWPRLWEVKDGEHQAQN